MAPQTPHRPQLHMFPKIVRISKGNQPFLAYGQFTEHVGQDSSSVLFASDTSCLGNQVIVY